MRNRIQCTGVIGQRFLFRGCWSRFHSGRFRQPEIQNLDHSPPRDKDVGGFDVAMHDPGGMRGFQRVQDWNHDLEQFFVGKGSLGDALLERLALHQFHHQIRPARVISDIVNRADIGVIECGDGLRLAPESFQQGLVRGHCIRQEFHGHRAAEASVARTIDLSHTALSERPLDLVRSHCSSEHKHGCSRKLAGILCHERSRIVAEDGAEDGALAGSLLIDQIHHLPAQGGIVTASGCHKRIALAGGQLARRVNQLLDLSRTPVARGVGTILSHDSV